MHWGGIKVTKVKRKKSVKEKWARQKKKRREPEGMGKKGKEKKWERKWKKRKRGEQQERKRKRL